MKLVKNGFRAAEAAKTNFVENFLVFIRATTCTVMNLELKKKFQKVTENVVHGKKIRVFNNLRHSHAHFHESQTKHSKTEHCGREQVFATSKKILPQLPVLHCTHWVILDIVGIFGNYLIHLHKTMRMGYF